MRAGTSWRRRRRRRWLASALLISLLPVVRSPVMVSLFVQHTLAAMLLRRSCLPVQPPRPEPPSPWSSVERLEQAADWRAPPHLSTSPAPQEALDQVAEGLRGC